MSERTARSAIGRADIGSGEVERAEPAPARPALFVDASRLGPDASRLEPASSRLGPAGIRREPGELTASRDVQVAGGSELRPRVRVTDLLLAASGWAVIALAALHAPVPLRIIATFVFVGACPGLASRRWLPAASRFERLTYAIAASMSLAVLVTLVLALGHVLTYGVALGCLAAATSLAALGGAALPAAPSGAEGPDRPPAAAGEVPTSR